MFFAAQWWLLDKCEGFSHKTQRGVGLNCFSLSRICVIIAFVLFPAGLTIYTNKYFLLLIFCLPWFIFTVKNIERYERKAFLDSLNGAANPLKSEDEYLRTFILFSNLVRTTSFFVFFDISYSFLLFFWSFFFDTHYYFYACDPFPPAQSKFKKWLEARKKARRERKEAREKERKPVPGALPEPI